MSSVLGQYKSPFHNLPDPVWSGPRHIPKAPLLLRSLPHPLSCSCTNLIVSQIAQTHSRLAAFAPAAHSSPRYPYGQCPHPLGTQMSPFQQNQSWPLFEITVSLHDSQFPLLSSIFTCSFSKICHFLTLKNNLLISIYCNTISPRIHAPQGQRFLAFTPCVSWDPRAVCGT